MNRIIITTIGTSLLNNAARLNLNADSAALLDFLKSDPQKASAETNSLSRLLQEGDEVVLVHSHTSEGETCAKILLSYLESRHINARKREVQQLQYNEKNFVRLGLKNLVQTLADEIRKARRNGCEIIINATGGFKAEIAYATAVGLLFKAPVCYIHEKFGDIVTLPATPIGWDVTIISENEGFFDWIDAEPRPRHEVESRLHNLPDAIKMLLEDAEDGNIYLSAMGEAYIEAFRARIEESSYIPLYFSNSTWRAWEKMEPARRELYERQFKRLRIPEIRARVVELISPSDALIFPQGYGDERIFFTEKEDKIHVLELTQHGRDYDALIKKGVRWRDYQNDEFHVWE